MFKVEMSSARSATTALTVLAAMGASGMVAEAAVLTYEPSVAVRTPNSSYSYMPGNWINWLNESGWNGIGYSNGDVANGALQRAFINWNLNFATLDPITNALFKVRVNNLSQAYGIPSGAHLRFELITDNWDAINPKPLPDTDGPDVESSSAVVVASPGTVYFEADISSLLQIWQASPTAYHGVRFYSTDSAGGVYSPNMPDDPRTAELVLTTTQVPEPTSLGALVVGSLLALRRNRR